MGNVKCCFVMGIVCVVMNSLELIFWSVITILNFGNDQTLTLYWVLLKILLATIFIFFNAILVFGAHKHNRIAILVWVVFAILSKTFHLANYIFPFIPFSFHSSWISIGILKDPLWIILTHFRYSEQLYSYLDSMIEVIEFLLSIWSLVVAIKAIQEIKKE